MLWICPATGHVIDRRVAGGVLDPSETFCPHHGVLLFWACVKCGESWTITREWLSDTPARGTDFCKACGAPAPWLTREQIVKWIRHQIQASQEIDPATRYELVEVLGKLQGMDPGDTKAIPGWEAIKTRAPKVWAVARPVLVSIVSGEVKKWLGV